MVDEVQACTKQYSQHIVINQTLDLRDFPFIMAGHNSI